MDATSPDRLDAWRLIALARGATASPPCAACGPLNGPGWESMPGSFDRSLLVRVGTLRDPDATEPTLDEFHPDGTHRWSPEAPIAVGHHPYNLCDVWQCRTCRRAYLRYTEYGGYYEDERVRPVDPARVVTAGI